MVNHFKHLVAGGLLMLALITLPAQAATLRANPETLKAQLAVAKPGDTVRLDRNRLYGDVTLPAKDHATPVQIDANGATLRSLRIQNTAGWTWRGGTIVGELPPLQYFAVAIDNARRIEVVGTTLTGTMVGVTVTRGSEDIEIRGNTATGLQSDGFNVAGARRVDLIGNECLDARPVLPIFNSLGKLVKDGTHNDCIQLWTAIDTKTGVITETSDVRIIGNRALTYGQGIGQYWSGGPIRNVLVAYNIVRSDTWNAISFSNAEGLDIRHNRVTTVPGATAPNFPFQPIRAWILDKLGKAVRCGNVVDGKPEQPCSSN